MPLPSKKPAHIDYGQDAPSLFQQTVYEQDLEQWEGLVWYVVNRITPRLPKAVSEEELHAAGMMGLWKAARSYDPSKGAEFKTYAYHRIRGASLQFKLRRTRYGNFFTECNGNSNHISKNMIAIGSSS